MPKKLIKRVLPDHLEFRNHKSVRFLGALLHDPNLWHLNRRSVSGAVGLGLFMAWMPVPSQMVLSAILSIALRVNLPIAVVSVWVTNPITMPPMFYMAYRLGAAMLGIQPKGFEFQLSFSWLIETLSEIWQPFLTGCVVMGIISSGLGYLAVRLYWRWHIYRALQKRRHKNRSSR